MTTVPVIDGKTSVKEWPVLQFKLVPSEMVTSGWAGIKCVKDDALYVLIEFYTLPWIGATEGDWAMVLADVGEHTTAKQQRVLAFLIVNEAGKYKATAYEYVTAKELDIQGFQGAGSEEVLREGEIKKEIFEFRIPLNSLSYLNNMAFQARYTYSGIEFVHPEKSEIWKHIELSPIHRFVDIKQEKNPYIAHETRPAEGYSYWNTYGAVYRYYLGVASIYDPVEAYVIVKDPETGKEVKRVPYKIQYNPANTMYPFAMFATVNTNEVPMRHALLPWLWGKGSSYYRTQDVIIDSYGNMLVTREGNLVVHSYLDLLIMAIPILLPLLILVILILLVRMRKRAKRI